MGQIIKSLAFVRLSVSLSVNGRNFDSILMKFCTVIRGLKSKIEFVLDKNLITPSPILPRLCVETDHRLPGISEIQARRGYKKSWIVR